ncbi:MAG: RNA polymerase sigma factor, partial [Natronosporangium sp.]
MGDVADALDRVWRAESGGMLGVLTRRLGDLDRAEEALQDALGQALVHWPDEGVPDNPAGWLVTAAWRKAVDRLRREATGRDKLAALANTPPPEPTGDDRLALIFACCHPALPEPAQVALTLNAVTGLTAEQIAAGFLVPTATMAQRLVRAKRQLREAGVRFEPPEEADYPTRLPALLSTLYLIFNEGYLASSRETPQRRELALEALDLARQLADQLPAEPEVAGLAALLELHEARAATRFDGWGRLVLLEDQDRRRWDRPMIQSAVARLGRAMAYGRPGSYQLQAGIAAQHALAPTYARTNWTRIRALYDQLHALTGSPVVLLSR